jgi:hypothetical protein
MQTIGLCLNGGLAICCSRAGAKYQQSPFICLEDRLRLYIMREFENRIKVYTPLKHVTYLHRSRIQLAGHILPT